VMPSELTAIATGYLGSLALIVGPVMATAVVGALVAVSAQGGWNVSWQPLQPKFSKLSPLNGVKRLVPTKAGLDLVRVALVATALGYVAWGVIQPFVETSPLLSRVSLADAAGSAWLTVLTLVKRGLIVFATIATADYLLKRYQMRKSLKMTKQEVKEEHKMLEGNPEIKGRVRRLQREMARRRMLAAVPNATVVITNPTHFAVALEYKRDAMAAPRVLAKGADHVAQRIKDVAREHGIPTVENVTLARALYAHAEIDEVIPADLFEAVAEVLAYLVRLKQLAI
jgi:flagellar biosynthesis protein FlhB